ncbi:MAG: hypothetical protein HY237_03625 [Acidobacteria bacterium]|nr:hypothetical protein [Acidobacteriota bacterium]
MVTEMAEHLASGAMPSDSQWIAGHYFNSALFRIGANYERVLTAITVTDSKSLKRQGGVPALLQKVELNIPVENLERVRKETNKNKHSNVSHLSPREITFEQLVASFEEWLLLVEVYRSKVLSVGDGPRK